MTVRISPIKRVTTLMAFCPRKRVRAWPLTKVAQVTAIYDKRRVLAIDVPWTDAKKVRGLLVQGDRIDVVDVNGKRTEFK